MTRPPVRVRFAPSPTGYLHIGGVRTALFNWLYARHHGGTYILRVDDTDQQRNLSEALQPILDGFRWLDLDWDEGVEVGGAHAPYFQSQRLERYQAAVEKLLAAGYAYRDFARPEEIVGRAHRGRGRRSGRIIASRRWAAWSGEDRTRFAAEERSSVVRLKMPREGQCRIADRSPRRSGDRVGERGRSRHPARRRHLPLSPGKRRRRRRDGNHPRHSRRGASLEHTAPDLDLPGTRARRCPSFAHLPVVAEPGSRVKLSKRKLDKYLKNPEFAELYERGKRIAERLGARPCLAETFNPVIVDFYRVAGFQPEAILNYLMLLGWSLDDKTEILTDEERIAHFSLERVNKSAASFDPQKLLSFQERYMQALPLDERTGRVLPYVRRRRSGSPRRPPTRKTRGNVRAIVAAAGERIKVAGDILDYDEFFVADEALAYDEKAFDKRIRNARTRRGAAGRAARRARGGGRTSTPRGAGAPVPLPSSRAADWGSATSSTRCASR